MTSGKHLPESPRGEVLVYRTEDGRVKLDVRLQDETLWLTQSDMAQLFQCSADNISLHLKNIYEEGEFSQGATTEEFSIVRQEGPRNVKRREYKESIGESEYIKQLEAAAKQLPEKPKKNRGKPAATEGKGGDGA